MEQKGTKKKKERKRYLSWIVKFKRLGLERGKRRSGKSLERD
jgi:hypothetical protein